MIHFDLPKIEVRISELEKESMKEDFWEDPKNSQKVLQESKILKEKIEKYNSLEGKGEDVVVLIDLALEEEDES